MYKEVCNLFAIRKKAEVRRSIAKIRGSTPNTRVAQKYLDAKSDCTVVIRFLNLYRKYSMCALHCPDIRTMHIHVRTLHIIVSTYASSIHNRM